MLRREVHRQPEHDAEGRADETEHSCVWQWGERNPDLAEEPQQAESHPAHAQGNGHHEVTSSAALDLRALLGRTRRSPSQADAPLKQTALAQPAVFVIEYALARLLMAWGILPQAMLGYSLGEYVAACLAGVFSLEDALTLVATRAQLIAAQPPGAMLAVALSEAQVRPYLSEQISLAIKLVQDPLGRQNRNQRSGVLVDSFQYKVISSSDQ